MRFSFPLAAAIVASGCATIVNGGNQDVAFNSTPAGATLLVDGIDMGATPTVLSLSRKGTHNVELALDGYEPQALVIDRKLNTWVLGNIVFGGLIGIAVDAISGGMYKLTPDQVEMALGEMAVTENGDALMIAVVLEPQADWEKIGQLTPTS